jgi:2-polyprenyl-3-methyl-5-hydroxy-6-metoxy-1,4-benzoquinol methylase
MDARIRQLDPQQVLDAERFMEYEEQLGRSWLIERLLPLIDRPEMKICDVGGARGVFLDELARRCRLPIRGTILEVDARHREQLIRPEFEFLQGSVVENDLPSGAYDFVTFQHVLHHLVSDSRRNTLALQEQAVSEMVRITRPGGYLLFEEQVNRVKPLSQAVYVLSRLANRNQLRWKYFEMGGVVVSYLTPGEIRTWVDRECAEGRLEPLEAEFTPWKMPWRWRLTVLMAWSGVVSYVLRRSPD